MVFAACSGDSETPSEHEPDSLMYLNACWGGCTITRGQIDDSSANISSAVLGAGPFRVSEFRWGHTTWDAVVQCVKRMYSAYNVAIVDVDPGDQEHYEAIVAGSPTEIGRPNDVAGVAPFDCQGVPRAMTYSFANVGGGAVANLCWTVAQETAHAFGLEHEFHCPDPMTYLSGCGAKQFQDFDAECGRDVAEPCQCGASTQNSHRKLLAVLGPSPPSPPQVVITTPMDNESLPSGFAVRTTITDNIDVTRAELYIDGELVSTIENQPWVFNAPTNLRPGERIVEVRGYDDLGTPGTATVRVIVLD